MSTNKVGKVDFREIYKRMIANYTSNKEIEKSKEDYLELKELEGLIIGDDYDKNNNEDTLHDILLLLEIIKKEKNIK